MADSDTVLHHIESLLVRDLLTMKKEIDAYPKDGLIWECPPGITNPAGTLALHCCGNLQHYVGQMLGGTSYVRDRENEFENRSMSRAELGAEINITIDTLRTVLPALDPGVLQSTFPVQVGGVDLNTQQFLMHLCTHLSMHLGQTGYLRRIQTGENVSSGPGGLRAIAER